MKTPWGLAWVSGWTHGDHSASWGTRRGDGCAVSAGVDSESFVTTRKSSSCLQTPTPQGRNALEYAETGPNCVLPFLFPKRTPRPWCPGQTHLGPSAYTASLSVCLSRVLPSFGPHRPPSLAHRSAEMFSWGLQKGPQGLLGPGEGGRAKLGATCQKRHPTGPPFCPRGLFGISSSLTTSLQKRNSSNSNGNSTSEAHGGQVPATHGLLSKEMTLSPLSWHRGGRQSKVSKSCASFTLWNHRILTGETECKYHQTTQSHPPGQRKICITTRGNAHDDSIPALTPGS